MSWSGPGWRQDRHYRDHIPCPCDGKSPASVREFHSGPARLRTTGGWAGKEAARDQFFECISKERCIRRVNPWKGVLPHDFG